jgi:hypothetical protein
LIFANSLYFVYNSLVTNENVGKNSEITNNIIKLSNINTQILSMQNSFKAYFISNSITNFEQAKTKYTTLKSAFNSIGENVFDMKKSEIIDKIAHKAQEYYTANIKLDTLLKKSPNPTIRRVIMGQVFSKISKIENKINEDFNILVQEMKKESDTRVQNMQNSAKSKLFYISLL